LHKTTANQSIQYYNISTSLLIKKQRDMKRNTFTRVLKLLFIVLFVMGIGKVGWGLDILTFPFSANGTASNSSVIVANRTCTVSLINITAGTIGSNYFPASQVLLMIIGQHLILFQPDIGT
jgi:hypothetical protein